MPVNTKYGYNAIAALQSALISTSVGNANANHSSSPGNTRWRSSWCSTSWTNTAARYAPRGPPPTTTAGACLLRCTTAAGGSSFSSITTDRLQRPAGSVSVLTYCWCPSRKSSGDARSCMASASSRRSRSTRTPASSITPANWSATTRAKRAKSATCGRLHLGVPHQPALEPRRRRRRQHRALHQPLVQAELLVRGGRPDDLDPRLAANPRGRGADLRLRDGRRAHDPVPLPSRVPEQVVERA